MHVFVCIILAYFPHSAIGWFVICDICITWSLSHLINWHDYISLNQYKLLTADNYVKCIISLADETKRELFCEIDKYHDFKM